MEERHAIIEKNSRIIVEEFPTLDDAIIFIRDMRHSGYDTNSLEIAEIKDDDEGFW